MTDSEVSLAPFIAAHHLPLLHDWLHRPHIARWFGAAAPQLAACLNPDSDSGHSVICVAGAPAGYLRWRKVSRAMLDDLNLHDIPAGAIDIDIFLADPTARGKSIGPIALALLTATLQAPLFGLTTALANEPAQRAFAKAGFLKHCQYDAPGYGRCWLMVK